MLEVLEAFDLTRPIQKKLRVSELFRKKSPQDCCSFPSRDYSERVKRNVLLFGSMAGLCGLFVGTAGLIGSAVAYGSTLALGTVAYSSLKENMNTHTLEQYNQYLV
eukprot:TRINITY_DN2696_c0_g1_i1.p1 TRINITY_DN2696_c0_g1~~TRINITY_DN2696_c0_g1_i1.p1  ORF type:complete len:106 (-),score=15.74 TRINITY_DN2696_c0_g1_i1:108-425(-)